MKIGIVCYPTYGGSGVVATELGIALANTGHEVHFIAYKQPFRLSYFHENISFHEVTFADYPLFEYPPYETALASKLVDAVKFSKLEVIHVHYAIPHASAALLAKQILAAQNIHIPVITTLHGTDITLVGKDPTYAPVVTYSINNSDAVTAVSADLRRQTYDTFDISKEIEVIPNFINTHIYRPDNKSHFKKAIAPHGEKIIIHTSNFREVKRIEDVIYVFYELRKNIDAKLLLVGDGPERQKAEQLCRQLGTCSDTRFLGKQDAINELLAISDLFILPSAAESFGLAALEAMACGVPVISSNAGGIPEVNIQGVTGFLSEVGNVNEMAANALRLLENNDLLEQFKTNALAQAQQFSTERIVPEYEKLYGNLVKKIEMKFVAP
ncbi:MAG: N-acetyl-alpha-D-glucosaminyl L-malate synthase BshA [Chitinophagales bacterium]|nr:N-acetyl-alpha-D-glucosaminyl L-malate synthase BshA [Bacteroidota bacterium]MCB9043542.1 N-acetyl-alpha-D-glucosaminyl L-malate synthase BshA [Chitinophagales bacterium]